MTKNDNSGIIIVALIAVALLVFSGFKFSTIGQGCRAQGTFTSLGGGLYKMTLNYVDGGCRNLDGVNVFSQTNNPNPNAVSIGTGFILPYDQNMPVLYNHNFVLVSNNIISSNGNQKVTNVQGLSWNGASPEVGYGYYTLGFQAWYDSNTGVMFPLAGSMTFNDTSYVPTCVPSIACAPWGQCQNSGFGSGYNFTQNRACNDGCGASYTQTQSCILAGAGCMDSAATNYNPSATYNDGSCVYGTTPPITPPVNPPVTPPVNPPVNPPVTPPVDTSSLSALWIIIFISIAIGGIYLWRR